MKVELRWFKSVDDGDYKLQYREAYYEEWKDVPRVLEGAEQHDIDRGLPPVQHLRPMPPVKQPKEINE